MTTKTKPCFFCRLAEIDPPRPSIGKTLGGYHVCRECADFYGLIIMEKKEEKEEVKK